MKRYTKITPEGTTRGFKKVITPAIEFYDVFALPCSGIMQEAMFKTVDNKGRLLVVRPDSTLPIARMVSSRLKNSLLPVRLYYKQAVYRNNPTLTGRSNENMQMGVELLGVKGIRADLEILTTAVDSLAAVADDFRIELGHAEVFDALSHIRGINTAIGFVGGISLEIYLLHVEYILKPLQHAYHLSYWPKFFITLAISVPIAWIISKVCSIVTKTITKTKR